MEQNTFEKYIPGVESPAENAFEITPHDSNEIPHTRALFVGVGGTVKVDTIKGNTVTLVGCQNGSYHPIRVKKVYASGTSATNIVGLY